LLSNISELFLGIFNDSAGISVESFDLFVVVLDGLVDLVLVVLDAILPFLDSLLVFIFSSIVHFSEVLLVGFDFSMDLMEVTLELLSGISDVVMEASDDTQFIFESRRSFLEVFIEQLSESLLWAGSILGSWLEAAHNLAGSFVSLALEFMGVLGKLIQRLVKSIRKLFDLLYLIRVLAGNIIRDLFNFLLHLLVGIIKALLEFHELVVVGLLNLQNLLVDLQELIFSLVHDLVNAWLVFAIDAQSYVLSIFRVFFDLVRDAHRLLFIRSSVVRVAQILKCHRGRSSVRMEGQEPTTCLNWRRKQEANCEENASWYLLVW
jgi:hypothetical protein